MTPLTRSARAERTRPLHRGRLPDIRPDEQRVKIHLVLRVDFSPGARPCAKSGFSAREHPLLQRDSRRGCGVRPSKGRKAAKIDKLGRVQAGSEGLWVAVFAFPDVLHS